MVVKDIMTKNVVTVTPETSLQEVAKLLREKRISGIPVVNASTGNLVGIITLTDMLRILDSIYQSKKLERVHYEVTLSNSLKEVTQKAQVKDIMSRRVVTLKKDATIDEVMRMMYDRGVHTIPIMQGTELIGIIGKRDLVSACF